MGFKGSGAPGQTRTGDPLLRSQLSTLVRTCRSDRKVRENQQLVINGDKLLTPFSSPLSRGFAAICHNYYYISMTEKIVGPIKISIGVRAAFSGITLPRSGLLDRIPRANQLNWPKTQSPR